MSIPVVPPLDPDAPKQVLVPAANLAPVAGQSISSTPSPVLIPVSTPVPSSALPPATMTQEDILIRTGKTFIAALIPAVISAYNAGGTPKTADHAYLVAGFSAGAAALTYAWNNLSTLIGKSKAAKVQKDAVTLQTAVNNYLLTHGGKV
jgi:hypothetical protein